MVVLNSNRMFPLERILVPGVTSMGLSPNLDLMAVTSSSTDTVTIIDVQPTSATFHQVLAQVPVGNGPRGVAFDPLDEDILVCNELDNTLSIIDPLTLAVRKTVPSLVDAPFELAVTQRMTGFSFERGVYFAYVLGRNGEVAVFESGPDGVDGIGYDTTIGILPFIFQAPKEIVLDPLNLDASVYIAYEGPIDPATGASGTLGVGAVSRLRIESGPFGEIPLGSDPPNCRGLSFSVPLTLSQATGAISGIPSSIAFDEYENFTEYPSPASPFTSGTSAVVNGKAPIRELPLSTTPANTNEARFMFVGVPGADLLDVLSLGASGTPRVDTDVYQAGVQSVPVPGIRFIRGYFGQ